MLGFITTDAAIDSKALKACLADAVANSFNRITVDGDMSTNDTVIVLANGMAGNAPLKTGSAELKLFGAALNHVCLQLARKIVLDGEGVTRFVTVRVTGAKSFADADAAARAVANSSLVRTSWFGGDPNWGRVLAAVGYSSATMIEEKVDMAYTTKGGKPLFALKNGQPTKTSFAALCKITAQKEFDLHINLNLGTSGAVVYAADLTEEYVDFNKGDVSDPTSLGG
jgi:glutamate N-acetyltransferase/amino-acid N-acetyltransferase